MEYDGEIVEEVNGEGIGEDNGGNELEVPRIMVLMVDEIISDVETFNVSIWEVKKDSFFITP